MAIFTESLTGRLATLREKNPHAYPRDYAAMLGTTEAELTPLFYPGRTSVLHNPEAVFAAVAGLPRVKLMARTAFAVFEIFTRVDFHREAGAFVLQSDTSFVALNPAGLGKIYFLSPASEKEKAAILIFDIAGAAALKIYIEPGEFDSSLPNAGAAAPVLDTPVAALLAVTRSPSAAITTDTPRRLIEEAAARQGRLAFELSTVTVAVYMKHAPVKLVDARGWFNILDEDFNLHLKEEAIQKIETGGAMQLVGENGEAIKLWSLT